MPRSQADEAVCPEIPEDFRYSKTPGSPVKDTPISKPGEGSKRWLDGRCERSNAREMRKWCVGPMPVQEFLETFLPAPLGVNGKRSMPSFKNAFNGVPTSPKDAQDIYSKLINSINGKKRCPSLIFADTSAQPKESMKPEICAYEETSLRALKQEKKQRIPAHLGFAELFIDVQKSKDRDPFQDPPRNSTSPRSEHNFFVEHKNKHERARVERRLGRIVAYAAEVCARQHRMFYFSVLITGTRARLVRWDRAGAIVTNSFDYRRTPKAFCTFLWRFGLANPAQRGYDPTVTVASKVEEKLFEEAITAHVALQLNISGEELKKAVSQHYQQDKVAKVDVVGEDNLGLPVTRQYLVSRPVMSPSSVTSRSTRGYWAVNVGSLKMAFLKDVWRIDTEKLEKEEKELVAMSDGVEVEQTEIEAGEKIVDQDEILNATRHEETGATGLVEDEAEEAEGDAVDPPEDFITNPQCTRTNEFVFAAWACSGGRQIKVSGYIHYRLLLKAVGYSLCEFKGTREMFEATHDAFEALLDAHTICDTLHRDVSLNNVILVRDPVTGRRRGILIDWEMSSTAVDGKATDHDIRGTWRFMSTDALSKCGDFCHTIQDDMESMLYIVLYCCVRWLPHSEVNILGGRMHNFFDHYLDEGNCTIVGGIGKTIQKYNRNFTDMFAFEDTHTQHWITKSYDYLAPPVAGFERSSGKWTPESFNELWVHTCQGPLPEHDRVERDVSYKRLNFEWESDMWLSTSRQSVKRAASDAFSSGNLTGEAPDKKRKRVR
ncbi:hypothetical protein DFH11DRAFT_1301272 [Phellopilus nigrolimitatus]|nr:hypothetical protein DFH11DRAFT_1301272 [Phellopilus nigrolimitatus]